MDELAWRLVDHVVVQLHGRTASQIAVPLLDPLPGYISPAYGTSGQDASGARSLLAGFVMCVWALYEAHRDADNGLPALALMSVHHKASVHEGSGGLTWWSRACATDREAISLLNVKDADLLTKDQQAQRHPRKPRNPPLYCYIGGGVGRQPECITSFVVHTKDAALTAAVVTVCRILGGSFENRNGPLAAVEGWSLDARQLDPGDFHAESAALLDLLEAMWAPWACLSPQDARANLCGAMELGPGWLPLALPPAAADAAGGAAGGTDDNEPDVDWGGSTDDDD
jgi:hypothetical protein